MKNIGDRLDGADENVFSILVVDDEIPVGEIIARCLESDDRFVLYARDGYEAVAAVERRRFDLVFLDINMPGVNGIQTLKKIRQLDRDVSVIMMTGYGTIQDAVETIKSGAEDFLLKPVAPETIIALASRIEMQKNSHRYLESAGLTDTPENGQPTLIARDVAMKKMLELLDRIAPLPSTVLVEGESGTGKELVARTIHARSPRVGQPFVAFNCAVIPEHLLESELFGHERGAFTGAANRKIGFFEAAQGGTIFLDEIGEMSFDLQAKLLRVLQERTFRRVGGIQEINTDVRVIAATNRDLEKEAAGGRFRKDLYYRINVVRVVVPPLRERPEDIPVLGEYFISHYATEFKKNVKGMDLQVMERLLGYSWGGNVRELQNVIERAVAVANTDTITLTDLPDEFLDNEFPVRSNGGEFKPYQEAKSDFELEYLKLAMDQSDGNIALAARLAGISRQHLYEKLARYGIAQGRFRRGKNGEVA